MSSLPPQAVKVEPALWQMVGRARLAFPVWEVPADKEEAPVLRGIADRAVPVGMVELAEWVVARVLEGPTGGPPETEVDRPVQQVLREEPLAVLVVQDQRGLLVQRPSRATTTPTARQ